MPKIEEYAEIVVDGQRYRNWKSVAVERTHQDPVMHAMFTVAEVGSAGAGWAAQRLRVGQKASVNLAGQLAIDGVIEARQGAYTPQEHGLQIGVVGATAKVVLSSAPTKPGEFKGYPLSAIAKAVLAPFGVNFEIKGNPEGADKPFPYVRVIMGESPWNLIERLARQRNLFLLASETGNGILAHRGGGDPVVAQLVEGKNIVQAQCLLQDKFAINKISVYGQRKGDDENYGDDLRVSASSFNPTATDATKQIIQLAEGPVDQQDAQMRADFEMANMVVNVVDCTVVVKGWTTSSGRLWVHEVSNQVSIVSPMLFPDGSMTLYIRSARCAQDDGGGTATTLNLCLYSGLGGGQIGAGGPSE